MPRITSKLKNKRIIVSRVVDADGRVWWPIKFKRLLREGEKPFEAVTVRGRVMTTQITLTQEAMNELVMNACELQEHAAREAKLTAREAAEKMEGDDAG